MFQKVMKPIEAVLEAASMDKDEVHEVILMGGSSRIPYLQNLLTEYFDKELRNSISVDEGVAMGATYMAAILTNQVAEKERAKIIVNDVISRSIGIQKLFNKVAILINQQCTIPCEKLEVFKTSKDN